MSTRFCARRTNSKPARPRICALLTPGCWANGNESIVHCQGECACAMRYARRRSRWYSACSVSSRRSTSATGTASRSAASSSSSSTRVMPLKLSSCSSARNCSRGVIVVVAVIAIEGEEVARHVPQHQVLQPREVEQAELQRLLYRRFERLARVGALDLQQ